jgi:hypothetical protein
VGQLLDRVIQQRRSANTATRSQADEFDRDQRIRVLEQRVEHLEALVEGLQDSDLISAAMDNEGARNPG